MIRMITRSIACAILLASGAAGVVWEVPEDENTIQEMIDDMRVEDGDTISVWGEGEPPFTYYENINYDGKALFIVNRSFLPDNNTGHDSCPIPVRT